MRAEDGRGGTGCVVGAVAGFALVRSGWSSDVRALREFPRWVADSDAARFLRQSRI